jgi:hypothetical protein
VVVAAMVAVELSIIEHAIKAPIILFLAPPTIDLLLPQQSRAPAREQAKRLSGIRSFILVREIES